MNNYPNINVINANDKISLSIPTPNLWVSFLLALIAGGLLALAFAPFSYALVAILSIAIFGYLLTIQPLHPFKLGLLFGMGYFGIGISWVFIPMYHYGNMNFLLSILASLLWVGIFALFPAFTAFITQKITKKFNIGDSLMLLLVFPSCWFLFEWMRTWILTGFQWLMLGTSQISTPLGNLLPITGELGVSFLVVLFSGLVVIASSNQIKPKLFSMLAIALLWSGCSFLTNIQWTEPTGNKINVALIRGNIDSSIKWQPEKFQNTIDYYINSSKQAKNVDLIVWPESALPIVYNKSQYLLYDLKQSLPNTDLIIGSIIKHNDGKYSNSLVYLSENKEIFYHKKHLVPFGEYTPLANGIIGWLMDNLQIPMSMLVAKNDDNNIIKVKNIKIAPSICYEVAFNNTIRQQASDANLLLTISDDAWFDGSLSSAQHLQIAQTRAKENAKPMIRATNKGITAIIDSKGVVKSFIDSQDRLLLIGEVSGYKGQTFYNQYGIYPFVILWFISILFIGFYVKRHH